LKRRDTKLGRVRKNRPSKSEPLTWETAPDILTVTEAAALVRISRAAAYGAIAAGFLPAHNFGARRIRVAKSALRQVFGLQKRDSDATAASGRNTGGNN
jgi:excisionase family DNA binding protein